MKKKIKKSVSVLSAMALVCFALIVGGCKKEPLVESSMREQIKNIEAPWEKIRYDYSYLETKLDQANQYLTSQKLSLEDLKQLHNLVNTVFGEYPTKIFSNWKQRNVDIFEDELFAHEKVKRMSYITIIDDFNPFKDRGMKYNLYDGSGIYLIPEHIGEREDYLFVPFKILQTAMPNNVQSWGQWMLVVKRSKNMSYQWKIYDIETMSYSLAVAPERYQKEWAVIYDGTDLLSRLKDPNSKYWINNEELDGAYWEYYNGQRDQRPVKDIKNIKKRQSSYKNHDVAKYAYKYSCQATSLANQNDTYCYRKIFKYWKGKDCANFASQCLLVGKIPMDNLWKCDPKNGKLEGSSTWRSCTMLFDHLLTKEYAEVISGLEIYNAYVQNQESDLQWGDLVFIRQEPYGYTKEHVVIVNHSYQHTNEYYNGTPRYTKSGHSQNQHDLQLDEYIADDGVIRYWDKRLFKRRVVGLHITY